MSICIPAYNAVRFIGETLKSALGQDYPNKEIIVSDDGSTDCTGEIVASFADRGVRLIRQEKNLGAAGNMNAAIRASSGKYVVKLDADDLLERQFISDLVPVMEAHPGVAYAHTACRLIDAEGNFLGYERSIHGSYIRRGLEEWRRCVFGSRALFIILLRRAAFEAVGGFDETFRTQESEDWKIQRDLLQVGDVYYCDRVLASYRIHATGKEGMRLVRARAYLRHLKDMEENWPPEIPGKERLLNRAHRQFALAAGRYAAQADPSEAEELLKLVPLYGDFITARLLAGLVRHGGGGLIRAYDQARWRLRQKVKMLFYKRPGKVIR